MHINYFAYKLTHFTFFISLCLREEANICTIKERIESLGRNYYQKALIIPHHPLNLNKDKYKYIPAYDKTKPIYNILQDL